MKYSDLNEIISAVSTEFGIPADIIISKNRTQPIAHARHVAIYLACKMTWMPKDDVAKAFNQRDHSSLFYGFNKVSEQMEQDTAFKKRVGGLVKLLESK